LSRTNVWSNPSQAGAAEVTQLAAFLEERARTPDMLEVNTAVCEMLAPAPGEEILEVGCGSGVLCRMIAPRLQPGGCVVGIDISAQFLHEARKYAFQQGLDGQIEFECGAGESLPYPNATFDRAFAARLLLHAGDPDAVVCEMARVVRPGGSVVVMDWDFDSVVVDHPDRELTRRLLHWRNDHHGGNNWSGRQLWRRMVAAGLQFLTVRSVVTVVHDEASGLTQSLWRAAQVARDNGGISPNEHDAWVGELKDRIPTGTFFASITYFIVSGIVS
jgi:ubiquinone/menaquinone biosynthesis C-methylase UbiE